MRQEAKKLANGDRSENAELGPSAPLSRFYSEFHFDEILYTQ